MVSREGEADRAVRAPRCGAKWRFACLLPELSMPALIFLTTFALSSHCFGAMFHLSRLVACAALSCLTVSAEIFPLDPNFRPEISGNLNNEFTAVFDLAVQKNGQIIAVGSFTNVNGFVRNGVVRFEADGSVDELFDVGTGPDNQVWCVALDSAGRIYVGGSFTTWNGSLSGALVRLLPTGEIDTGFALNGFSNIIGNVEIFEIYVQDDSHIHIAGFFTHYFGVLRPVLIRVDEQGSLHNSYAPDPQNLVLAVQPSSHYPGHMYISGGFRDIANQPPGVAARLNFEGVADRVFSPAFGQGDIAYSISETAGGAIYVGGDFDGPLVRKLDAQGGADVNFNVQFTAHDSFYVATLLPLGESVFVGGFFDVVDGPVRSCLGLVNAEGVVNREFGTTGANDLVNKLAFDGAGNLLVAGAFTTLDGQARTALARYLGPQITLINPIVTEGRFRFEFDSVRPARYHVQASSSLEGEWTTVETLDGTGNQLTFDVEADATHLFFRVEKE